MMKPRSLSPLPTRKKFTSKRLAVAGILTLVMLLALLALWSPLRHWQRQRRLRNLNVIDFYTRIGEKLIVSLEKR